jgi:hypothetical protein
LALFLCLIGILVVCLPEVKPAMASVEAEIAAVGCAATAASGLLTTSVAIDPHHLTFQTILGDEPPPSQAIAVQCFDYGNYYNDCGGTISVNQPWLRTDRNHFYGVDLVDVWVDPTDLEPGTYDGKIHVSYYLVAIDDEEDVNVELIIQEPSE